MAHLRDTPLRGAANPQLAATPPGAGTDPPSSVSRPAFGPSSRGIRRAITAALGGPASAARDPCISVTMVAHWGGQPLLSEGSIGRLCRRAPRVFVTGIGGIQGVAAWSASKHDVRLCAEASKILSIRSFRLVRRWPECPNRWVECPGVDRVMSVVGCFEHGFGVLEGGLAWRGGAR